MGSRTPSGCSEYEVDFRRAGLPLFGEDISASEDIFNRAAPLLGLVFLGELLGAGNLDWTWWQNVLAVAGGLAILLVAVAALNRARGRSFSAIPRRLGQDRAGGVRARAVGAAADLRRAAGQRAGHGAVRTSSCSR